MPRTIDHPLFANVSATDACERLKDAPVGEALFRPSSKGTDRLSLTWKMSAGGQGTGGQGAMPAVFVHLDIREGGKSVGAGAAANLRLGRPLTIDRPSGEARPAD